MKKGIAFFDFDGTVTNKDSMFKLFQFIHGYRKLCLGLLFFIPAFLKFKLGFTDRQTAKESLLRYFLGGMEEADFEEKCAAFSVLFLDCIVREEALKKIYWHKENQHDVVLVSASAENWLTAWCSRHNIKCIATRLESVDGKITGKIFGKNCYGEEKSKRIREEYSLADFEKIYAYGDSNGDKNMLALAHFPFYRCF